MVLLGYVISILLAYVGDKCIEQPKEILRKRYRKKYVEKCE